MVEKSAVTFSSINLLSWHVTICLLIWGLFEASMVFFRAVQIDLTTKGYYVCLNNINNGEYLGRGCDKLHHLSV